MEGKTVKESAERLRLPSEKPADRGNEAHLVPGAEEAIQIAIEGKDREEEKPERETGGGSRRFWPKALYGGAFAILAFGLGLFFLFSNQDNPQREEKPLEAKSEEEPKESLPLKETENSREKGSQDPAYPATKEPAPLTGTGKNSELPRSQPEAKGAAGSQTDKGPRVQTGLPKKKEGVGPKTTPGIGRQAAPASLREKADFRQLEKPSGDQEKATSGEQRNEASGDPAFTPAREPVSQGAEDVDPNKVIEWLIERRSDKR